MHRAHQQGFTQGQRQFGERSAQGRAFVGGDQPRLGVGLGLGGRKPPVAFEIADIDRVWRRAAAQKGQRDIARDRQHPGARLFNLLGLKRRQRPEAGLLHDVFRVGAVARQRFGKRISRVEMGQRDGGEAPPRQIAGGHERAHSNSVGARLQKFDDVGAILLIVEMIEHFRSGQEFLRIGEPLVERLLVPDDVRVFQRVGIGIIRQRSRLAAIDAAVARANFILVQRVAVLTALIQGLAARGVAGRTGGGGRGASGAERQQQREFCSCPASPRERRIGDGEMRIAGRINDVSDAEHAAQLSWGHF